jgi:hypothetical protein
LQAWNTHDIDCLVALFADTYVSDQPAHPGRSFTGSVQVRANWTGVFDGVPDFAAELLAFTVNGDIEWAEWSWKGRHPDNSAFAMRGVTILKIRDDLIARGRLYMEPVDGAGQDIDAAVRELYRPPDTPS